MKTQAVFNEVIINILILQNNTTILILILNYGIVRDIKLSCDLCYAATWLQLTQGNLKQGSNGNFTLDHLKKLNTKQQLVWITK